MAFKKNLQKRILCEAGTGTQKRLPCVMCGTSFPLPEAAHIVDSKEWSEKKDDDEVVNGFPLCPNCHKVFDDVLRPYLYRALEAFGTTNLPKCWKKSNKVSGVTESHLPINQNA